MDNIITITSETGKTSLTVDTSTLEIVAEGDYDEILDMLMKIGNFKNCKIKRGLTDEKSETD